MLVSVATQTDHSKSEACTQTDQQITGYNSDGEEELFSSQETVYPCDSVESVSPQKEKLRYLLSDLPESETDKQSTSLSEAEETEPENNTPPQDDMKYIVFQNELQQLMKYCPVCGSAVIKNESTTLGTLLCVTLTCLNLHTFKWQSQPMLGRMPAGNLLVSSAILLSGSTYTKMANFSEILNLQFLGEKTFYSMQDEYLFPEINDAWLSEQNSVFEEIGQTDLWLCGDGRCDSPGHSAKYGTYSMLDQATDKIVDLKVVQVSEVANSNAMEREGFKRCMETISGKGAVVKVVATDRHIGIAADIKRDHPEKEHQFDVWHVSKSITKKLTEKAKQKNCNELFPWIKSISNHLWWCSQNCGGDKTLLREMWISIIHHITNLHSWNCADVFHECCHPPIPLNVARTKKWLVPGSPPHEALKEVVLGKKLLKDLEQLHLFCHTGSLEVYHNVLTKYAPKRQHFSHKGMTARTQLAALDHNANTGRQQAREERGGNEGEPRYKFVYPKQTKDWVAKPLMEKTTRDHLKPMVEAIVRRKKQNVNERSAGIDTIHLSKNIAATPRPSREALIAKRTSRFANP